MGGKFVTPKADFCFKEIFRDVDVRRQFISDALDIPLGEIRSAVLANTFLPKQHRKAKQGVLDVLLVLQDGTKIDIELQVCPYKFWHQRSIFYLAQMYTENFSDGEGYSELKKCIGIYILDFSLTEDEEFHKVYTLQDDAGRKYGNLLEVHVIELKKKVRDDDKLKPWVELFNAESKEELEMIKTKSHGIVRAIGIVRNLNLTKALRYAYHMRVKEICDQNARDEYVYDEGHAKGVSVGEARQLIQLVCKKLRKGKPEALIAQELEEEPESIHRICEAAKAFAPEYDIAKIYEALER